MDDQEPKARGVTRGGMEAYVDERLAAEARRAIHLQAAYDELYRKHQVLLEERATRALPPSGSPLASKSHISDEAVDQFVTNLLQDPAVNIYGLPDRLEGAVYRNILKILLHSFVHASDTASLELLGHRVRLVVEPLLPANASPTSQDATGTQKEDE